MKVWIVRKLIWKTLLYLRKKEAKDEYILKLFDVAQKIIPNQDMQQKASHIKESFKVKTSTKGLIKRIILEPNLRCLYKFANNLFINSFFLGGRVREDFFKKHGTELPYFLVISPTMRCNLACVGCYAGSYEKNKEEELTIKEIHRIIKEAKSLGMYFFTISGGEPFFKENILEVFAKHNDCYFQIYTNGTLIDKNLAKKLAQLGNVSPAISIEGNEEFTDARRGKGVYKKVMEAMDNLREEGVIFGFSATPTRLNTDYLTSDEFIEKMIKKGTIFGWYFTYIPIGKNPDLNLMQTPQQRKYTAQRTREFFYTKPIFIGDFWNHGPYVGGCIAGGRRYLHINYRGDVEPCVFVHFAVDNIRRKSLKEIILSEFFRDIRSAQPYDENLYSPCMIIDNPQILRSVVKKHKAYPTHKGAESVISGSIAEFLDRYSQEYKELTYPMWEAFFAQDPLTQEARQRYERNKQKIQQLIDEAKESSFSNF